MESNKGSKMGRNWIGTYFGADLDGAIK